MENGKKDLVFVGELRYAARDLLRISLNLNTNEKGKGFVKELVFMSFTRGVKNGDSPTGFSFDMSSTETIMFDLPAVRGFVVALRNCGDGFLKPSSQLIRLNETSGKYVLNVDYKKFSDSSKSTQSSDTGKKSVSVAPFISGGKPLVAIRYVGTSSQQINLSLDPYQAMGFADELTRELDELSRFRSHYQRQVRENSVKNYQNSDYAYSH